MPRPPRFLPICTIVDRIASGAEHRRIRVLVGDGIAPVRRIRRGVNWQQLEKSRILTLRPMPDPSYFMLLQLARHRIIDVIVTTNYDCFLDATFGSASEVPAVFNPVLERDVLQCAQYCAPKTNRRRLRVWKIHGTLGAAFHRADGHIVSLPPTPCYRLGRDEMWDYGALAVQRPRVTGDTRSAYAHLIDWNQTKQNRQRFRLLIEAAAHDLTNETETAALLILGFNGYYNPHLPNDARNEELTPRLLRSVNRVPMFVYINRDQFRDNRYTLLDRISRSYPQNCSFRLETLFPIICERVTGWDRNTFDWRYRVWGEDQFLADEAAHALLETAGWRNT